MIQPVVSNWDSDYNFYDPKCSEGYVESIIQAHQIPFQIYEQYYLLPMGTLHVIFFAILFTAVTRSSIKDSQLLHRRSSSFLERRISFSMPGY